MKSWSMYLLVFALCFAMGSLLTGCALETTAAPSADLVPGKTITGTVYGGSQPIVGANVYLLAVNPGTYGGPGIAASSSNASVSMLSSQAGGGLDSIGFHAVTGSTGGFSLNGDFVCGSGYPQGSNARTVGLSSKQQIYLYILGGQPEYTAASANTSIGLLAALGPCNNPVTQVTVNEVTTVATAYAFAGFATDATHIGSSGRALALTGLNNAFANVTNLAVLSSGTAASGSSTLVTPAANLITIADVLAACVNGTTGNGNCATLFQYTESAGATGAAPTDTATAAINLAHNPYPTSAGVTALYRLVPATGAPFAGGVSAQPNDFTLGLTVKGGGLNFPEGVAIDASGNVWAPNYFGNSLSEFSNAGALISTTAYTGGGLNEPFAIAFDSTGNAWVSNNGQGAGLSEFSSAGTATSPSAGYTGGGLNRSRGIAVDASGNIWVANYSGNNLSEFSSTGTAKSPSGGYTGGGINQPLGLAIDTSGNVWVSDQTSSLSEFSSSGSATSPSAGYTGGGLSYPINIAIDASGNVWAADYVGNRLDKFSSTGAAITTSSGYTGGLNEPFGIAIDSSGNVWASNYRGNGISEFSSAGAAISESGGYTASGLEYQEGLAIDGSGDVWVADGTDNTLIELIGAASPVVTPIVANLLSPYAANASTVNRP